MTSPNDQATHAVERLGYTIDEVCRMVPCSRPTVYRLIAEKQLSRIKVGRKALITAPSLRRLFSDAAA